MTELEEQLQGRLNKAIEVFKQKEALIKELQETIEKKNKALNVLQDTYNEVFAENIKLNAKVEELQNSLDEKQSQVYDCDEDIDNYKNIIEDNRKEIIALNTKLGELEEEYSKLQIQAELDNQRYRESGTQMAYQIDTLKEQLEEVEKDNAHYIKVIEELTSAKNNNIKNDKLLNAFNAAISANNALYDSIEELFNTPADKESVPQKDKKPYVKPEAKIIDKKFVQDTNIFSV